MTDPTHTTDGGTDPAERHAARAAVYAGLAGAFCYPDDATAAELRDPAALAGLRDAAARVDVDADRVAAFADALEATDAASLRRIHDDLFGVPDDGTYPVVPYEAEYTVEDEVSHKQRRVATVSGLLDAFGFDIADGFDERHDHVAVELELMQVLAARRAVALDAGDDLESQAADLRRAEAALLDEHLEPFVPAFAAEVREALDERHSDDDAAAAYRAAVDLAEALVTVDAAAHPPAPTPGANDPATVGGGGSA